MREELHAEGACDLFLQGSETDREVERRMQLLRLGQDLVHTDRVELLDPVEHEDTDPHGDHREPTRP